MKKEDIHFNDLHRWLLGETPSPFAIEVFFRTLLIYAVLLLVVRLMGKRMAGQMTLTELAVMLTLGGIVSPVMQLPDRGILFGVLVLFCAYAFQRGWNLLAFKSPLIERLTQGSVSMLVKNGVIELRELEKTRITRQQLFAVLRDKKIYNLGKVERVYVEAGGTFSVFESEEKRSGLPILPTFDPVTDSIENRLDGALMACCSCGHVQQMTDSQTKCTVCHSVDWSHAYLSN